MYILTLTGGCCIHYLSNNLATCRKNVYEQLSVCCMGYLLFNVLRFDVPSSAARYKWSIILNWIQKNTFTVVDEHSKIREYHLRFITGIFSSFSWLLGHIRSPYVFKPTVQTHRVKKSYLMDTLRKWQSRCWFKICIWLVGKEAEFFRPRTQRSKAKPKQSWTSFYTLLKIALSVI